MWTSSLYVIVMAWCLIVDIDWGCAEEGKREKEKKRNKEDEGMSGCRGGKKKSGEDEGGSGWDEMRRERGIKYLKAGFMWNLLKVI